MTVQEVKKLKVGSIIRDYNGNLSKGSEYQVPSHFKSDTIVKY